MDLLFASAPTHSRLTPSTMQFLPVAAHRKNERKIGLLNFGSFLMINRAVAIYKHHFVEAHTDMVRLFLVTTLSIIITLGITFEQTNVRRAFVPKHRATENAQRGV